MKTANICKKKSKPPQMAIKVVNNSIKRYIPSDPNG